MQQLKLNSENTAFGNKINGFKHHAACLIRKPQYEMCNDLYSPASKLIRYNDEILNACMGIHGIKSALMDGLKAQLHPHGFDVIQLAQQIQHLLRQAVGTGGDGEGGDVGTVDDRFKEGLEALHWGVGVGVGLEVGDVAAAPKFGGNAGFGLGDLLLQRQVCRRGEVAGAAGGAEDTASVAQRPVSVGTGHAAVERQLVDFLPKLVFQPCV